MFAPNSMKSAGFYNLLNFRLFRERHFGAAGVGAWHQIFGRACRHPKTTHVTPCRPPFWGCRWRCSHVQRRRARRRFVSSRRSRNCRGRGREHCHSMRMQDHRHDRGLAGSRVLERTEEATLGRSRVGTLPPHSLGWYDARCGKEHVQAGSGTSVSSR
jgi:hypothetical protein